MNRTVAALILTTYVTACGGGGGGGGSTPAPEPPTSNPDSVPTTLVLLDSVPGPSVTNAEPGQSTSSFAYLGHSDLSLELSGDCSGFTGTTVRRDLFDLAVPDFDQLLDHKIKYSSCKPQKMIRMRFYLEMVLLAESQRITLSY